MNKAYRCLAVLVLLCSLLLSGCYSSIPDTPVQPPTTPDTSSSTDASVAEKTNSADSQITSTHSFSPDNLPGALTGLSVFPAENGFYFADSVVKYYDISQKAALILCNRAGCTHTDSDCPARIPHVTQLLAQEGVIYAFSESEGSISLVRLVPQTGEKTTVYALDATVGEIDYCLTNSFYADGHIYFLVTTTRTEEMTTAIYVYDTMTENTVTLVSCSELESASVEGAFNNHVIVLWSALKQAPLEMESYFLEHPQASEDDYYAYLNEFKEENLCSELREYDLKTLTYTDDILNALRGKSQEEPYLLFSSNGSFYGEYILYTLGDEIVRYSLKTGEREVLVKENNAVNGMLFDGKLIYLVMDTEGLKVCVFEPETGNTFTLNNAGNLQYMIFGIYRETKDAFIGYYNDRNAWILKEDFYNERYENAVFY